MVEVPLNINMFKFKFITFIVALNLFAKGDIENNCRKGLTPVGRQKLKINIFMKNAIIIEIPPGIFTKESQGFITKFKIFKINTDNIKSVLEYPTEIFNKAGFGTSPPLVLFNIKFKFS